MHMKSLLAYLLLTSACTTSRSSPGQLGASCLNNTDCSSNEICTPTRVCESVGGGDPVALTITSVTGDVMGDDTLIDSLLRVEGQGFDSSLAAQLLVSGTDQVFDLIVSNAMATSALLALPSRH